MTGWFGGTPTLGSLQINASWGLPNGTCSLAFNSGTLGPAGQGWLGWIETYAHTPESRGPFQNRWMSSLRRSKIQFLFFWKRNIAGLLSCPPGLLDSMEANLHCMKNPNPIHYLESEWYQPFHRPHFSHLGWLHLDIVLSSGIMRSVIISLIFDEHP